MFLLWVTMVLPSTDTILNTDNTTTKVEIARLRGETYLVCNKAGSDDKTNTQFKVVMNCS